MVTSSTSSMRRPLLIANEYDRRRIPRLHHRLQKESESHRSIITSFDARFFPRLPGPQPCHILADVPCSGDGMLRRNSRGWVDWSPEAGLQLFETQSGILSRAFDLLPPGGRLVYSTCTLDPIQNEAVVAHVMSSPIAQGISLLPLPSIKGVTIRPGLSTWIVPNSSESGQGVGIGDGVEQGVGEGVGKGLREGVGEGVGKGVGEGVGEGVGVGDVEGRGSNFAQKPTPMSPPDDEAIWRQLTRCGRLLPNDNDAGGFFIALFQRADNPPNESELCSEVGVESAQSNPQRRRGFREGVEGQGRGRGVGGAKVRGDRLRLVGGHGDGDAVWNEISEFYGIRPDGCFAAQNLMWSTTSDSGKAKGRICLVSDAAGDWIRQSWLPSVSSMPSVRRRLKHWGASTFWKVANNPAFSHREMLQ